MRVFFTLVIFIFVFLIFNFSAFAQAPSSATKFPPVNYTLPYPGILPNNPLYKIKVARDMLVGFFISDPLKKAEYDLSLTDKRTEAAQMLYDSGNQALALDTISKAQNYFNQAIEQINLAKKQGEFIVGDVNNMSNSNKLREYMLSNMVTYANSTLQARFNSELKRSVGFEAQLNKLLK